MLAAYVEHNLTPEEVRAVEAHLVRCYLCRETVVLTFRSKAAVKDPPISVPSK
jgi:hypothetical protein